MDSNLNLTLGFKGQLKLNAQAMPLQEGYLKLGGIVDSAATDGLKFGVVVSSDPDTPDNFAPGCADGNIIRGVCVFDDAIAQNAPAHPNKYLVNMPCAAINHGFMWLESWEKPTSGIDPTLGCKVVYNTTTGAIAFIAAATESAPSGYAVYENAEVRAIDDENGALIYLN